MEKRSPPAIFVAKLPSYCCTPPKQERNGNKRIIIVCKIVINSYGEPGKAPSPCILPPGSLQGARKYANLRKDYYAIHNTRKGNRVAHEGKVADRLLAKTWSAPGVPLGRQRPGQHRNGSSSMAVSARNARHQAKLCCTSCCYVACALFLCCPARNCSFHLPVC